MITDYQQVVPTQARCLTYLGWLESAFDISLKFWVKFDTTEGKLRPIVLCCVGSGAVYDLFSDREGFVTAPILSADHGSIYPAMWACLALVEYSMMAVSTAKTTRPSL